MDDPGSLIYIAFLVVSLIAGLINNRRKKQQNQPPTQTRQSTVNSQGQLDKAEIDRLVEEERIANEAAAKMLDDLRVNEEGIQRRRKRSRAMREATIDSDTFDADEDQVDDRGFLDFEEGFDARKAIIYSEILNPPHL